MVPFDKLQRNVYCIVLFLITGYFSGTTFGDWVPYSATLPAGAKCMVLVKQLHPTQCSVGFWEIDRRSDKVADKKDKKILKYMEEHIGKIVVGPGGEPYIIDRHHLACIMNRTGKSLTILATVEANFKSLTVDSFWNELIRRKWVYLYDENGKGPIDVLSLPKHIRELKDDPYRSLAWAVRENGGYEKTDKPFAEFQWANFFRAKFPVTDVNANMEILIQEALKLCPTSAAQNLPGYLDAVKTY